MKTNAAKQSIWALVILLFLTVAVGITLFLAGKRQEIRHKAAAGAVLELQPNSMQKFLGDDIELNVVVDTGTYSITTADIRIDFDTNYLQGVSISKGSFLSNILVEGNIAGGRARIVVGGDAVGTGSKGQGILATLHLRAINTTGGTNVVFSPDSMVAAFHAGDTTNVIESTIPSQIKIVARAVADTVLTPVTGSSNVQNGNEFDVNININTGSNSVTAADLVVTYDPQYLDGISINRGDFFTQVLSGGQISNGRATITLGTGSDVGARQGQGTLAILRFRAKATGSTAVVVDPSSQVSQDQQNMVKQWNQLSLNISDQPVVVSTPNPTPSASPGIGGGGGGGGTTCDKTAPAAPTNLRGIRVASNAVQLTWDYSHSAIVTRYSLVYGMQSGNYIYGVDNLGITNTYTVSQLNPTTTYYFAVRAYNDCAAVGYSNEVSVRGNVITNGGYVPVAPRARVTPLVSPLPVASPLPGFGEMPVSSDIPFLNRPNPTAAQFVYSISPSPDASPAAKSLLSGSVWMVALKAIQDYWWWLLLFIVLIVTGIYLNHKRR